MTVARYECARWVAQFFGDAGLEAFGAMPVSFTSGRSCIQVSPVSARVLMSPLDCGMTWLHETTHYLSWLWFRGEFMNAARHGGHAQVEAAALVPHVWAAQRRNVDAQGFLREALLAGGPHGKAVMRAHSAAAARRGGAALRYALVAR